jgi:NitT/TauT family transport system ATP-binding protein
MSEPLLSLQDVSRRFPNGLLALEHVSLQVRAGEFVALLGPSGCGKSTVLRLAAGLDAPSAGLVQAPALREPSTAQTAFVFQDATLMPWARVADNVWLPLRLAGVPRAQAQPRIRDTLARVGLGDFEHAFPNELSGGMRMRVSIARALVTRPRLLLMDEPFAALDEFTRHQLNDDLLACWRAEGFATLFVTHSLTEAVFLAERVLVMGPRPGRIVADVRIEAPSPRTRAFRHSAGFVAACEQLARALETAHAGHEGAA